MSNILIDRPEPNVRRIRINRPSKLNAVDYDVREELTHALTEALGDASTRALVLGGVGGNLSAGGDVPSMIGLSTKQAGERLDHIHNICRMVASARLPIVTAVEGWAAGASVGLALLGDYVIVGPDTKILVPFFTLGLVPDWGLLRSLPARVGIPAARRIILESRTIGGEEAVRIGLADYLVDDALVADIAVEKAAMLARLPQQAFARVKARWAKPAASLQEDLIREREDQIACLTGSEFVEGFASFSEKRVPDFIACRQ